MLIIKFQGFNKFYVQLKDVIKLWM